MRFWIKDVNRWCLFGKDRCGKGSGVERKERVRGCVKHLGCANNNTHKIKKNYLINKKEKKSELEFLRLKVCWMDFDPTASSKKT